MNLLILRKIVIALLCFCFFHGFAQDKTIDSLKRVLNKAINDTSKLSALKSLVDALPEGEWKKYNVDMKASAEKMLQKNLQNKIVKRTTLKYYAMAIRNDAINLINTNKNTEAIPLLEKCIKIYLEIGESSEGGLTYNDLASA